VTKQRQRRGSATEALKLRERGKREGVGAVRTVTPRVTETIIKSLKW
jgi:hypothetical protein